MSKAPINYEKVSVKLNSKYTDMVCYLMKSTRGNVKVERALDLETQDPSSDTDITKIIRFGKSKPRIPVNTVLYT